MIKKISVVIISILFTVFLAAAQNVAKKPIEIDFFTKVKRIANLKVNGDNVFFILSNPDKENNNYTSALYQLIDGKPVRLTKDVSDYFFQDGNIIFKSVREEKDRESIKRGEELTIFQELSPGFGEADEWLRLPFQTEQIEWIDKDDFFYTASYDRNFDQLLKANKGNKKEALKQKEENKSYRVFDELPFWSNGRGDISGRRTHLYLYNKGERKLLTDTLESVSSPELSPDKKTLVYTSKPAFYGKAQEENRLISLDVETQKKKEWSFFDKATYGDFEFLNNDEIVLTINRSKEHNKIENSGFYRLNLRTGKLNLIYDGSVYGLGNGITTDIGGNGKAKITFDQEGINYITTAIDQAPLVHVSFKNGKASFLTKGDISIQEYLPYKDGFLAVALIGQQGSEIYFIDKEGNVSPLTEINKPVFDQYKVVKPIEVTFTNEEGKKLKGYVLPPVDYDKTKKYPAILDIHGGPKSTYGTVFFHEMQYWANQGYAVLFTNPTGSDGRGSQFSDITGKVGGIDYRDLLTFVDVALKQIDFIDANRLGVTGGSYGGFMTNWIIGHTNRFKAAVSQRSISSWQSFSNTSDIGYTFSYRYWGTDIWKNNQLLWDGSPLKYANQVKTPTLFLHSDEDYRCWLVEGLQMYYALQYFEISTRMVVFKGENHELSRSGKPSNRIKRLDEITHWFDKYLKQN